MRTQLLLILGYPLLLIALVETVLGVLLLAHNPRRSPVHKTVAAFSFFAAAFAFFTGLMYVLAPTGRDVTPLARATWVGWLMIPAALQFVYFIRDERGRAARIVGYTLYPFWLLVLGVSMSTHLIEQGSYAVMPYIDRSGMLAKPLRAVGVLQLLWVMAAVYRLRRSVSGTRRAQLNYFTHGLLIFSVGGVLVSGILQFFGGLGFDPSLSAYFSLAWVGLTFFAMTRHRLFDIRIVVSHTVTVALLIVLLSFVQLGMFRLLGPVFGPSLAVVVSLIFIGVIAFGTTFRREVERGVQRIVLQHKYDYQTALREAIKVIPTILDLQELLDYLIHSVRASLGVRIAFLFLRDEDGKYRRQSGAGWFMEPAGPAVADDGVVEWIARNKEVLIREELEETLPGEEYRSLGNWMEQNAASVVIPLLYKGRLQGMLLLGEKSGHDPYSRGDIDLLEALASHAATATEHARLFTEVRNSQQSLQESEAKFRTLAQTTPAAIFIHRGGKLLFVNRTAESMSGYTHEELLSMHFWDIVHPDHRELVRERGLTRLSGSVSPAQYEFKVIRKDGSERWGLMTAAVMEYGGQPAIIGTVFDITERKALEGRLRYAQKMEAIGKLAGGVAHDFNNILTTIVGHANILRLKTMSDDSLQEHVDRILASTERAANMTQTLLAFGKKEAASPRRDDLTGIVRKTEKLLAGLLRGEIELTVHSAAAPLPVLVDAGQIERVLMNLVVNARDAMPDGGVVTVRTGTADLDAGFIRARGFGKEGSYAFVSVRDTGMGIDDAVREKIFEPFFSTKSPDKGTGFGLSIVYDIVKEHHGYVTADSDPGRGATFTIYLPLAGAAPAETAPAEGPARMGGTETILLVENDADVREYMKAVLQGQGYRVVEAESGPEAVAKFEKEAAAFRLVLVDVILPGMNGVEAYEAVSAVRPGVPVLFTSGYSGEALIEEGVAGPGRPFLLKPFSSRELLAAVRRVLDEDEAGEPAGSAGNSV